MSARQKQDGPAEGDEEAATAGAAAAAAVKGSDGSGQEQGSGSGSDSSGSDSDGSSSSDSDDSTSSDDSGDGKAAGADRSIALVLHGNATLTLRHFNEHFVCKICDGYMRDCHTLTDCLHSFCGPCLKLRFLHGSQHCPHCNMYLGAQPHEKALPDHLLQRVCDTVFPSFAASDKAAEAAWRADNGQAPEGGAGKRPRPAGASVGERHSKKSRHHDSSAAKTVAMTMSVKLVPLATNDERTLPPLSKPLLKTTTELRVEHLRKHLSRRLKLCNPWEVDILCKGQPLGGELSLDFIFKTRWRGSKQMVLHYRRNAASAARAAAESSRKAAAAAPAASSKAAKGK